MNQAAELAAAVSHALRAPSIHNTQPWCWRIRPPSIELHADWTRHLPFTDPDRRGLILSCGAALHHLRVALAAQDFDAQVTRLPDPENLGYLARVTVRPGPSDAEAARLFPAIARRRTERRRMSHQPVPANAVRQCVAEAGREGAALVPISTPEMLCELRSALVDAAHDQELTPGYAAELQLWTQRFAGSRDGVSADSVADSPPGLVNPSPLRRFPRGQLRQPRQSGGTGSADNAAELLVLATDADDYLAWLRAGEATSAVLLTAPLLGLATTPLSQVVEVADIRQRLRQTLLNATQYPQLLLRIGWPASTAEEPPPATARRELRSVLLPS